MNIDVCNGDADGLCAVLQWRLNTPQPACLITGLKRDIALLDRVRAVAGDELLVCDVSLRRNRWPLLRLLQAGVSVRYFDHHAPGDVPVHPLLQAHVDVAGDTCTSLLVDRYLNRQYQAWAVVGAFGDNLTAVADGLAAGLGLSFEDRRRLQTLGEAINYNAYGDSEQDVLLAPQRLYERMARYSDPLVFLAQESIAVELAARRQSDLQQARSLAPHYQDGRVTVYLLPDAPWSRRVSGSLSNALASAQPLQALAVLRATACGDYVVSVRAPMSAPSGAAEFCRGFGGDGRAGAAGIDHLPAWQLPPFIEAFAASPWGRPAGAPGHI